MLKDNKEYYLFFSNPTCGYFSSQKINLVNKAIERHPEVLTVKKDEYYLYSFSDKEQFYIVTSVKKTSSLRMYKYNYVTNVFDVHEIKLNALTFPNSSKVIQLWNVIAEDNSASSTNPYYFNFLKMQL